MFAHAAGGPDGDLVDLSQSPERAVGSGAGRGESMLTCGFGFTWLVVAAGW
jgi:hypothetical protein